MKKTIWAVLSVLLAMGTAQAAVVTMEWDAVTANADGSTPLTDLAGYRVFRATASLMGLTTTQAMTAGGVFRHTTGAGILTLAIGGLSDGASHYFRMAAYDTSGNQSGFNVDGSGSDVQVSTFTPLPAPTGLSATAASASQINLSWTDASNNETGFRIERSVDNVTFALVTTTAANATTYSDTGLSDSTQYFYRVRAVNALTNSGWAAGNATTQAAGDVMPPARPQGLRIR
jgi:predicted phage tail protein